jgi:hypothetical protein
VPRDQSNLWQVGKHRAEATCRSDKGIAAGCAGWVVYKSIAYLKSTTEGAVQLKPGSSRVMFVRNPAFSGEVVVDREGEREHEQD